MVLFIHTDVTVTCQDLDIIDRLNIYLSFIITVTALHTLAAVNTHKNIINQILWFVFGSSLFPDYLYACECVNETLTYNTL